ncbi:YqcC family protein [Psittacicella hinzii]|uniref:YqcC-like domain-containing protein n=1 Tax=Psittacicella hinzii TaxID=2028575 RepID=A0A3A1YLK7_9GAMM|nr:YqcC family protein [Psittacicella hinzii]RIY38545.1 hypothetical protein CKF58_04065 [Psittacicella hinzii]
MNSQIRNQLIAQLKHIQALLKKSTVLSTKPITMAQRHYKEPFGIDCMEPSQWLYHIYTEYAIKALNQEQWEIFASIEGFTFFFSYTWKELDHPDTEQIIAKLQEFEDTCVAHIPQKRSK